MPFGSFHSAWGCFGPFLLHLLSQFIMAYWDARYAWGSQWTAFMEMSTFFMSVHVIPCLSEWWWLYVAQHVVTVFWKWERHHWGQTRSPGPSLFFFPSLCSRCITQLSLTHYRIRSFGRSLQHCCNHFLKLCFCVSVHSRQIVPSWTGLACKFIKLQRVLGLQKTSLDICFHTFWIPAGNTDWGYLLALSS